MPEKIVLSDAMERELLSFDLLALEALVPVINEMIRQRRDEMPTLFGSISHCKVCLDTGKVGEIYCSCPTGQELKRKAAGKREDTFADMPLFA